MRERIAIDKHLMLVNGASSVLRKVLSLTVLVWLQQYLVRRIDAGEYSLLPVLSALIVFFPLLTTMFVAGLRRYVTDAFARDEEEEVTRLVSTMLPMLVGMAAVLMGLGGFAAWHIDSLLEIEPGLLDDARWMFLLLVFGAALRIALSPLGMGFDLRQRFLRRNLIGLAAELFRTALLLVLLLLSTRVLWVVVSSTAATVLEVLWTTRASVRLVPAVRFRRGSFRREAARPLISFGGWSVLNQLALMIRDAADPLILNRLATPAAVASFHLGSLVDRHVRTTFLVASSAALPAVTAMNATGQEQRLRAAYLRMSRYALWGLGFLAVPLVVFRRELMQLYLGQTYSTYAAAAAVMGLLLARVVVIYPNSILGMLAAAKTEVRALALRGALVSAANLALTFYLVGARGMGAVGSALATFLVTIVGAPLLNWSLGLRLSDTGLRQWLASTLLPGALPIASTAGALLAWQRVAPPDSWLELFAACLLGSGVYAAALWFGAMGAAERRELGRYVARFTSRR